MKWKLSIALFLLNTNSINANEINVLLGGWSQHLEQQATHLPKYNEKHNGFGLEYHQEYKQNRYWLVGINYLKDSYQKNAFGLALGWQYRWQWEDFFFNSGWFIGAQSRSQTVTYFYPETNNRAFSHIKRTWLPMGGLRLGIGYTHFSSTLSVLPTIANTNQKWKLNDPVLYWQFAIHLPSNALKDLWSTAILSSQEKHMTAHAKQITMKPHYF